MLRVTQDYIEEFLCNWYNSAFCSLALKIAGNGLFQLGDITNISCSTPVQVDILQWVNSSNNSIVRQERDVQELVLDIDIRVDSNGTQYFCEVVEGNFTAESGNITIDVGGNWLSERSEAKPLSVHVT